MGEPDAVAVAAFGRAVAGKRGELDAWLEVHDEAEVRAMIVAYAGHAKVPEFGKWLPIETAPKKGFILATDGVDNFVVWWSYGNWAYASDCNGEDIDVASTLTHWMPLPPPPDAKEGK